MFWLVFLSFFLTVGLILILRPMARRIGLIDQPTQRKNHEVPTILVGGVAIVLVMLSHLPTLPYLGLGPLPANICYLAAALALVVMTGFMDDLWQLSFKVIFPLQLCAALVVTLIGGVTIDSLGDLFGFGKVSVASFQLLFTVVCFVGVINAFNMIDGVDGLAGSISLTAVIWFAVLAILSERLRLYTILLVLAGALAGFLLFNLRSPWLKRAQIFMGNAGSMSLGFLMAWFAITLVKNPNVHIYPITMVYVVGLPLIDMARVMLSRVAHGHSPFIGDRRHIHHLLLDAGCSVSQTVLLKTLASAVLGGIGVFGWHYGLPEWLLFYGFIVILSLYFYLTEFRWPDVYRYIRILTSARRV
jgi:UDP-GlcNAc:undecaprenyl-phosphate GlcNAc-1-phosphate transferase